MNKDFVYTIEVNAYPVPSDDDNKFLWAVHQVNTTTLQSTVFKSGSSDSPETAFFTAAAELRRATGAHISNTKEVYQPVYELEGGNTWCGNIFNTYDAAYDFAEGVDQVAVGPSCYKDVINRTVQKRQYVLGRCL